MLKPIIHFRNAVAEAVEQDEEELTYEYNFHLDPYKTCDYKQTNYASFSDYDQLLDRDCKMVDRKKFWHYYCLQRAIDTL